METAAGFDELSRLLPEPLLLVRTDGAIESANAAAARLLGRSQASLPGCALTDFLADPPAEIQAMLRNFARSRQMGPAGATLRAGDGRAIPLRCEGAVFRPRSDEQAALVLLRLTGKAEGAAQFLLLKQQVEELSAEIHRRRRAEAALHETTERLRVTLSSIGDAVIATDPQGLIEFINPVAQQLTGWDGRQALGRHLDEVFVIVSEDTREPVESPVAKVLRLGTIVGLANHTLLVRRDGTELPIDDSGAPIRDSGGVMTGVVLVFRDLSERHAMERELVARAARLEEADRRKDEFLSMLAHELRNPLAPLASGVQLLARRFDHVSEIAQLAALMQRQVRHMSRLVDDLLDVARFTRGQVELQKGPVELAQLVQQALEMARPALEARRLALRLALPPRPLLLHADATRLVQVFANLLSNSAKFCEPGDSVEVVVEGSAADAQVVVKDSGIGIEPELLSRVFDLFVQGDRSIDRTQGGLGLGLTIARAIVNMHGGSIEARSAGAGRGAEFAVRLPLGPEGPGAEPPQATPAAAAHGGVNVLVVDDNVDAAATLCALLELLGHSATPVHDPQAALLWVRERPPQAVVLDIGLPGMDGFELARAIRAGPHPQPLLVAVSGYGDEQARRRSSESGIDAHLTKPAQADELDRILRGGAAG